MKADELWKLHHRRLPTAAPRSYRPRPKGRAEAMKHIDPKTLHGWISDGQELAVIDAREDGEFGADHLFWAVPFGMAHRETRAQTLLPRKSVRICVTDDGGRPRQAL